MFASGLRESADLTCIQTWATEIAAQTPRVQGGTAIDERQWPQCLRVVPFDGGGRSFRPQRVLVMQDGSVLVFLDRTWRLSVNVDKKLAPRLWFIGERIYLGVVEA